jgi:diguanylate cyclase (GGDEF)-like protein/PAS domain S-box-containing protein
LEQHAYLDFQESYQKILTKHREFYENRVKANIGSNGIKEALAAHDRERLYNLSKGRWETLSHENQYLQVMHFHLPEGTSFLRMHKPDAYGDAIAEQRPMLQKIHKEHKSVYGFEAGVYNFVYRIILPIFYNDEYIGALEFGSRPEQILEEMHYFYNTNGALFLKKNELTKENNKAIFEIGDYSLVFANAPEQEILKNLGIEYHFEQLKYLNVGEKSYLLYAFDLPDYNGHSVAKVLFFNDITQVQNEFFYTLQKLFFTLLLLLISLLLIVNYGFQGLMNLLEKSNQELSKTLKKLQSNMELIDQNVITSSTDLDGTITEVSEAFCKISGYSKAELLGSTHKVVRHEDMPDDFFMQMWEALTKNEIYKCELKNARKDESFYWLSATIYPRYDAKHNKVGYTAIYEDITDKKYIEKLSITDGLTGIFNRRHFNEMFPKILASAKRHNELVSLMIMDIDFFKQFNDTYGHQMGDKALTLVAQTVYKTLQRGDDYCFRLGGEEFGVLFRPKTAADAVVLAEKIKKEISALMIEHETSSVMPFLSVSIGLATKKASEIESEDKFYKEADDLLYKAKANGRNCVVAA